MCEEACLTHENIQKKEVLTYAEVLLMWETFREHLPLAFDLWITIGIQRSTNDLLRKRKLLWWNLHVFGGPSGLKK